MSLMSLKKLKEKLKTYSNYIFVFAFILMFISLTRNILRVKGAKEKVKGSQERVERLKEENKELEEKVKAVKSEEFIEKQLRDKLGLAKEGETIVVLPEEETLKKLGVSVEEEEEILPDPIWKKWLNLFY